MTSSQLPPSDTAIAPSSGTQAVAPATASPNTEPPEEPAESEEGRMSFMDHLGELRQRLRNAVLVFLGTMLISFVVVKHYFEFLTRPARAAYKGALGKDPTWVFVSPTEPFWVYTKLAMIGALLAASPLIFWELWKFVAPGLYKKEKRAVLFITIATAGFFIAGSIFGYAVLTKPALSYMFSFAETVNAGVDVGFQIDPMITMQEMVSFMLSILMGTGVAFELPVILSVLGWMGLVTAKGLWKFDKYALVLSTLVGGILTPGPDILSQVLMAGPLFALYNLSIGVVWLIERTRKRKEVDEEAAREAEYAADEAARKAAKVANGVTTPPQDPGAAP